MFEYFYRWKKWSYNSKSSLLKLALWHRICSWEDYLSPLSLCFLLGSSNKVFWKEDFMAGGERDRFLSFGIFFLFLPPIPVSVTSPAFSPPNQHFVSLSNLPPLTELVLLCPLRDIFTRWLVSLSLMFGLTPWGRLLSSEVRVESSDTTFSKVWVSTPQDPLSRSLNFNNQKLFPLYPNAKSSSCFWICYFCYISVIPVGLFCSSISRILYSKFSLLNQLMQISGSRLYPELL